MPITVQSFIYCKKKIKNKEVYLCTNFFPPCSMLRFVCFILLYFRSTFYLAAFLVLLTFLHFHVFLKMGASSALNAKKQKGYQ